MDIILASASPRRTEILQLAGIKHRVVVSDIEEVIDNKLTPAEVVQSIACQKAQAVAINYPNDLVIGADTVVVIDNIILGKPHGRDEAIAMLKHLSGQIHQVITGIAIINKDNISTWYVSTEVTFNEMSNAEIIDYLDRENVYDKAGSYAIQGFACRYIKAINGDYYNVMGLPIAKLFEEIKYLIDK